MVRMKTLLSRTGLRGSGKWLGKNKSSEKAPVAKSTRRSFRKRKEFEKAETEDPYLPVQNQTDCVNNRETQVSADITKTQVDTQCLSKEEAIKILERSSLERPANIKAIIQWAYIPTHATDIAVYESEEVTAYYKAGEWLHIENRKGATGFVPATYCSFNYTADIATEASAATAENSNSDNNHTAGSNEGVDTQEHQEITDPPSEITQDLTATEVEEQSANDDSETNTEAPIDLSNKDSVDSAKEEISQRSDEEHPEKTVDKPTEDTTDIMRMKLFRSSDNTDKNSDASSVENSSSIDKQSELEKESVASSCGKESKSSSKSSDDGKKNGVGSFVRKLSKKDKSSDTNKSKQSKSLLQLSRKSSKSASRDSLKSQQEYSGYYDKQRKEALMSEAFKNKLEWYSELFDDTSGESSDEDVETPKRSKSTGSHGKLRSSTSIESNLSTSSRSRVFSGASATRLLNSFQQKELDARLQFASNDPKKKSTDSLNSLSQGYAQIRKISSNPSLNQTPAKKPLKHTNSADPSDKLLSPLVPIHVELSQPTQQAPPKTEAPITSCLKKKLRMLVAYDFIAEDPNDVTVLTGQFVEVLNQTDDDWWWVKTHDQRIGFAPRNFLTPIPTLPNRKPDLIRKLIDSKVVRGTSPSAELTEVDRDSVKSSDHFARNRSRSLNDNQTQLHIKTARVAPRIRQVEPQSEDYDDIDLWKKQAADMPLPSYDQYLEQRQRENKVPYCEPIDMAERGMRGWRSQENLKVNVELDTGAGIRILRRKSFSGRRNSQKKVRFSTPDLENEISKKKPGQILLIRQFDDETTGKTESTQKYVSPSTDYDSIPSWDETYADYIPTDHGNYFADAAGTWC